MELAIFFHARAWQWRIQLLVVQFSAAALIHAKTPAVLFTIAFALLVHVNTGEKVIWKEEGNYIEYWWEMK